MSFLCAEVSHAVLVECRHFYTNQSSPVGPIEQLFSARSKFEEGYSEIKHRQSFWKIHKRFGFVRLDYGKIALVAKNETIANQLIEDLYKYTGNPIDTVKRIFIEEINEGVHYDVTNLMNDTVRNLLDVQPRSGPNCWNLCLVHARSIERFTSVSANEFRHWVNGPYSQEIKKISHLRPGDILSIHDNWGVSHAAIYISDKMVLTKNGGDGSRGYRLMDINEMGSIYFQPGYEVKAYRIRDASLDFGMLKSYFSSTYWGLVASVEAVEAYKSNQIASGAYLSKSDFPKLKEDLFNEMQIYFKEQFINEMATVPTNARFKLQWFWRALDERVKSL